MLEQSFVSGHVFRVCVSTRFESLRWDMNAEIAADSAAERRHEVSPVRERRVEWKN